MARYFSGPQPLHKKYRARLAGTPLMRSFFATRSKRLLRPAQTAMHFDRERFKQAQAKPLLSESREKAAPSGAAKGYSSGMPGKNGGTAGTPSADKPYPAGVTARTARPSAKTPDSSDAACCAHWSTFLRWHDPDQVQRDQGIAALSQPLRAPPVEFMVQLYTAQGRMSIRRPSRGAFSSARGRPGFLPRTAAGREIRRSL